MFIRHEDKNIENVLHLMKAGEIVTMKGVSVTSTPTLKRDGINYSAYGKIQNYFI